MNSLLTRFAAAVLTCFLPSVAAASSDTQLWGALAVTGAVNDDSRALVWFDGHARSRDNVSDLGVSIIRPGVGWRVNDKLSLWVGYASVVARRENAANLRENRIWQQATFAIGEFAGGNFSGRTRLEQRFSDLGNDTGWRIRQFVRYARPFEDTNYSFIAWNELFVGFNDTDWGARAGYDQNRTFIGGGWQVVKNIRLEGGYLLNNINRDGPSVTNHVISFGIFAAL